MKAQTADLVDRYRIKNQIHYGPIGATFKLADLDNKKANLQCKFIKDEKSFKKEIDIIRRVQASK